MPNFPWLQAVVLVVSLVWHQFAHAGWPHFDFPPRTDVFMVGEEMSFNNQSMRIQGFSSESASISEMLLWFRKTAGHFSQSRLEDKVILGQMRKNYYITIQMQPERNGVSGWLAMTDLKASKNSASAFATATGPDFWLPDSNLVSEVSSTEAGREISQVVVLNGYSVNLNKERLVASLARQGYSLERIFDLDDIANADVEYERTANTFYFKGLGKEAMAIMAPAANGKTSIVLQTTVFNRLPEHAK
jgi:hypothetical protein